MGFGPVVNWRQYSVSELINRSKVSIVIAISTGLLLIYFESEHNTSELMQMFLGVFLAVWVTAQSSADWYKRAKRKSGFKFSGISASHYAMYLAHFGLTVVVIGVVLSSHLSLEKVVRLGPGQSHQLGEYVFQFDQVTNFNAANYDGIRGKFTVYEDSEEVALLEPEKRKYHASGQWMTEAGIHANMRRDLYIALGEKLPNSDDWAIRIYVKPFVTWLWLGGFLMGLGGFIAITDKRYRNVGRKKTASVIKSLAEDTAEVEAT